MYACMPCVPHVCMERWHIHSHITLHITDYYSTLIISVGSSSFNSSPFLIFVLFSPIVEDQLRLSITCSFPLDLSIHSLHRELRQNCSLSISLKR